MSSHRADKHRAPDVAKQPATKPVVSGHHRAPRAPRRVGKVASPSLIGGLALVAATIGAATAGQEVSAGHDVSRASAQQGGAYVATLSGASLEGRNATRVSRAGIRPLLTNDAAATTAAQRRTSRLNDAAGVAEDYAQELADQRREILREAARAAKVNALADDEWVMPTSGYDISTWFGESGASWSSGYHTGIDFATAYGTPGVAVANATVVQTGWDGAYGNQVRLQLENGDEVWYNPLSSIDVVSGQSVVKGQQVGRIGDTGNSYGAHLHFEYRLASNLSDGVDPRPYLLEHGLAL